MPDSSSKSGSPRQPSSRPPFQGSAFRAEPSSRPPFSGDWPGITTFITAPLFRRLAGDPLFERIPARKADPQHNLHHGPLSGGVRFFRRDCALFFRTFGCFFPLCGVRTFFARSAEPLKTSDFAHTCLELSRCPKANHVQQHPTPTCHPRAQPLPL